MGNFWTCGDEVGEIGPVIDQLVERNVKEAVQIAVEQVGEFGFVSRKGELLIQFWSMEMDEEDFLFAGGACVKSHYMKEHLLSDVFLNDVESFDSEERESIASELERIATAIRERSYD